MTLSAKAIRTLKKWMKEVDVPAEETVQKEATDKKTRVKKEKLTPKQKKELEAKKEAEALGKGKTTEDIGKKDEKEKE